jgi:hypothetical protein
LWVRATDPIVNRLQILDLCELGDFPYLNYKYLNNIILDIKKLFDIWCESNMVEYYEYVDILMASGIDGNEDEFEKYKIMIFKDIEILSKLTSLAENNCLAKNGINYINSLLTN